MKNSTLNKIFILSLLLALFMVFFVEPVVVKGETYPCEINQDLRLTVTNVKFEMDDRGLKQIVSVVYPYGITENLWGYVTKPYEVKRGDKIYAVSKENLQLVSIIK